jgi:hypothetical protein
VKVASLHYVTTPSPYPFNQEEVLGAQLNEQQGSPLAPQVKSKMPGHSTRRTRSAMKPSSASTPSSLPNHPFLTV